MFVDVRVFNLVSPCSWSAVPKRATFAVHSGCHASGALRGRESKAGHCFPCRLKLTQCLVSRNLSLNFEHPVIAVSTSPVMLVIVFPRNVVSGKDVSLRLFQNTVETRRPTRRRYVKASWCLLWSTACAPAGPEPRSTGTDTSPYSETCACRWNDSEQFLSWGTA